ncbi:MAG: hypothetical protein WBD31_15995 [Rubripirellula sp.]
MNQQLQLENVHGGCLACGHTGQRLRRGLCSRHYQQFLRRQSEKLETDGTGAAEIFENDCIWRGLLKHKEKGGRPSQDDHDVFSSISARPKDLPSLDRLRDRIISPLLSTILSPYSLAKRQLVGLVADKMRATIDNHFLDASGRSSDDGETVAVANEMTHGVDQHPTTDPVEDAVVSLRESLPLRTNSTPLQVAQQHAHWCKQLLIETVEHKIAHFRLRSDLYQRMQEKLSPAQEHPSNEHTNLRFRHQLLLSQADSNKDDKKHLEAIPIEAFELLLFAGRSADEVTTLMNIPQDELRLIQSRMKVRLLKQFRELSQIAS